MLTITKQTIKKTMKRQNETATFLTGHTILDYIKIQSQTYANLGVYISALLSKNIRKIPPSNKTTLLSISPLFVHGTASPLETYRLCRISEDALVTSWAN